MAPDELGGRGDREPFLGRRAVAVVALVAAVVVGLGLAGQVTGGEPAADPGPARPTASPRSTQAAEPPTPAPVSGGWVVNDAVCPVLTDGRRLLIVRFILANRSGQDLEVTAVEPVLPLGGLRPRSASTIAGDCNRWVPTASGNAALPRDGQRVVSMLFRLPDECATPYPVGARVRVTGAAGTQTVRMGVLSDLGGVSFDACREDPL